MKNIYIRLARSRWPLAQWIIGSGAFAAVALCDVITIRLYCTEEEAQIERQQLDQFRGFCGPGRAHLVVNVQTGRRYRRSTTMAQPKKKGAQKK